MKNYSVLTFIVSMFVLISLGSSCGPEPPDPPDPPKPSVPTTVTDIDGNIYHVKRFGSILWMTENLRVMRYDTASSRSGIPIAVASSNQSVDYNQPYYIDLREFEDAPYTDNLTSEIRKSMGLLYNWSAAAGTTENNTSAGNGVQGICPNGWSLPSNKDIDSLLFYLGGKEIAGQKLKAKQGWYLSGSGTNESEMNCYPAGLAVSHYVNELVGQQTMFWTSVSQYGNNNKAGVLQLLYNKDDAIKLDIGKFQASSVRCVKHIKLSDYTIP
jgi:uncharacterized protein (TIGR02145 family)